jgi:hypothetical protein
MTLCMSIRMFGPQNHSSNLDSTDSTQKKIWVNLISVLIRPTTEFLYVQSNCNEDNLVEAYFIA